MKHKIIALGLLLLILVTAASVYGCDKVAKLAGVAISRCIHRDVTLSFDGHTDTDGDRTFVTISDEDAKRIYETLKPYYEKH